MPTLVVDQFITRSDNFAVLLHDPASGKTAAIDAPEADPMIARLKELGAHRQRTDGGPIRRAMGNLRVAVGERVSRGEFSQDTLHDVAALIDEVAQKIERLR